VKKLILFVSSLCVCCAQNPAVLVQVVESPVQGGRIWMLSHTPTLAGVSCMQGGVALKPGKDYLWLGSNFLRPIKVNAQGNWIQSSWLPGAVTCTYLYQPPPKTP
jgi:hypothetical protein